MKGPPAGAVALGGALLGAAGIAGAVVMAPLNGDAALAAGHALSTYLLIGAFTIFGVVGTVVAWRRPRNPIGWLFLTGFVLIGVLAYAQEHATYALGVAPGALPMGLLAAWFANWGWFPALGIFLLFVPLLFPTGRPPSPRWWIVGWVGGIALAASTAHSALSERLVGDTYAVDNPVGLQGIVTEQGTLHEIAGVVLAAAVLAAVASLVVRFRRSRGEERQQLKWFTFAASLVPGLLLIDILDVPIPDVLADVPFAIVVGLLPLAAGLAILRYRLYDIDRIISRTVSYGLLTGVLAVVYLGAVLTLTRVLAPLGASSDLAVAAATLGAAAVFSPARRRIQRTVDRRFNRARYDAERVASRFRARLRHEVDLDELRVELRATVQATVQPATLTLWLRAEATR